MPPEDASLLQTPQQLLDMAEAFKKSRVLLTAMELDIFSILDRGNDQGNAAGMSSRDVAEAAGCDERGADRLLRACCSLGLVQLSGQGRFANTPAGQSFLVRGKDSFLGSLDHLNTLYRTWARLTESVRKGGSVMDEPDMAQRDGSWFEPFMAAMYTRGRKTADDLVARLDLANVSSVLDLGGGPGAHAMAFARAKQGLQATVFDLPQVTPITRRYVHKDGMQQQVDTRDGDFRRDDLKKPDGTGYDLVFVSAIVHMFSPHDNVMLLKRVYEAVAPGGRVVVLDFVMDEERLRPAFGALFSINMIVSTPQGDSYTESEIKSWLDQAGFTDVQRIEADGPTAFVQGVKPV